jgi:hypothetical protein
MDSIRGPEGGSEEIRQIENERIKDKQGSKPQVTSISSPAATDDIKEPTKRLGDFFDVVCQLEKAAPGLAQVVSATRRRLQSHGGNISTDSKTQPIVPKIPP